MFDYRNSIVNSTGKARRNLGVAAGGDNVILQASAEYSAESDLLNGTTQGTPVSVKLLSSDFTPSGALIGQARTDYLGTKGAEVAS